jgi:hypothetical protein
MRSSCFLCALSSSLNEMTLLMRVSFCPFVARRPVLKADSVTAIYEPIVWRIWEPPCFRTLSASTVGYRNSFTCLESILRPPCWESGD